MTLLLHLGLGYTNAQMTCSTPSALPPNLAKLHVATHMRQPCSHAKRQPHEAPCIGLHERQAPKPNSLAQSSRVQVVVGCMDCCGYGCAFPMRPLCIVPSALAAFGASARVYLHEQTLSTLWRIISAWHWHVRTWRRRHIHINCPLRKAIFRFELHQADPLKPAKARYSDYRP